MLFRRIAVLISICLGGMGAFGQEKTDQPTSMEPVFPKKDYSPKTKKKSKKSETTYDARNNFYDRQEMLNKQRIKNEKNGNNPQYADRQYFGHKRPPRKRPASKMKFCKVCGIRH
jgi:hypothetical protein